MAFAIGVADALVAFTLTPMMASRILPMPAAEGRGAPTCSIFERL